MGRKKLNFYISPLLIIMLIALISFGYVYDCIIFFTTIVLHELAHAEVSTRLGFALDRLILMPYGAALMGKFEGAGPRDEIYIALAGPLFNACVALICAALWWIFPVTYVFTDRLAAANIFTALFNMIPVFPLDGGRIALAALSVKMPRQKAYRIIKIFGFIASPVFAILFVLTLFFGNAANFSFALISVFMLVSTVFPDKNSTYRRLYSMAFFSERLKHGLKEQRIMVSADSTLIRLDRMLNSNYYTYFVVVKDDIDGAACVSETDLTELLIKYPPDTKIGQIERPANK